MKPDKRSVLIGAAAAAVLLSNGCVEPFPGSNIQVSFRAGTQVPGDRDIDDRADDGRPPAGTHYMFVAVRSGDDGESAFAFEVAEFDVVPIIDPSGPCFIEDERSPFPGLHSTQLVAKLRAELDVPEGAEFDPDTPMDSAIRILTAERRVGDQNLLSNTLKAVVEHTPFEAPAPGTLCANDAGYDDTLIPPPECLDDESSAARRALCLAIFDEHPQYYVGNDEVLSTPTNGVFLGAVDGSDERNGQLYGGAQFFVDTNLEDIDALLINFQYDCSIEDFANPDIGPQLCAPQFPADLPDSQQSPIGFHYMSGTPQAGQQRGVIRISLQNRLFQSLRAEAGIFVDLDDDRINF